ncbi:MAG TPA: DNA-binding protein, partial [Hyphomonas sp.]|nr:DNA-binding protein [Hyphomonas sp.]
MARPGEQEFFTPRELAEIASARGLLGFPATERGVRKLADREGWNELPKRLARWRVDPAGGRPAMEYHRSLLPDMLQAAIHAQAQKAAGTALLVAEADADRRKMAALRATALSARARSVMEARAEILSSIEGYAISQGQSRAWGIARFLDAQDQWRQRQESEARRDQGQFLTERDAAGLARPLLLTAADGFQLMPAKIAAANDRRKVSQVSRRTIYDWFKARDTRGVVALAPEATKEHAPIPGGFADFLRFYAVGSKPTITDAHRDYLAAAAQRPATQPMTLSLSQVEYILRVRLNNIERNVGREGLLTLRKRLAYVTRTTDDMWPTTVYTADGKTFDAEVADPVSGRPMRPEITSVLDVATRKCVGYAVSRKENVIAVTEALRRSCSSHGICAIFYTDRGAGYKNKTFDADAGGLMGRLGITKAHALPYNSQAKGIIERFNAHWNALAKRMPTY